MAKVTGPLMSMSASGKLADAIVFFTWKGRNIVRQWLKPANPQTTQQGDVRIMMGGTGRAVGRIVKDQDFHQQLIDLELIPAGQTKQSYMVDYLKTQYLSTTTLYIAELANITGHTAYTSFQSGADDLGILEFDLDYATIAPYDKCLGIFLLAKAAIALSFTGSPYTSGISAWTGAHIDELVIDMQGA